MSIETDMELDRLHSEPQEDAMTSNLAEAEDYAIGSLDSGETPRQGAWHERRARLLAEQREQADRRRRSVLTRLGWRPDGRTLEQCARSLAWPGGTPGVLTVLEQLAADGLAHQRDGLWRPGPAPAQEERVEPEEERRPLGEVVLESADEWTTPGQLVALVEPRAPWASRTEIGLEVSRLREAGGLVESKMRTQVRRRASDSQDAGAPAAVSTAADPGPSSSVGGTPPLVPGEFGGHAATPEDPGAAAGRDLRAEDEPRAGRQSRGGRPMAEVGGSSPPPSSAGEDGPGPGAAQCGTARGGAARPRAAVAPDSDPPVQADRAMNQATRDGGGGPVPPVASGAWDPRGSTPTLQQRREAAGLSRAQLAGRMTALDPARPLAGTRAYIGQVERGAKRASDEWLALADRALAGEVPASPPAASPAPATAPTPRTDIRDRLRAVVEAEPGQTIKEVAAELGCDPTRVSQLVREPGSGYTVVRDGVRRRLYPSAERAREGEASPEHLAVVLAYVSQHPGCSSADVAAHIGRSTSWARRCMTEAGCERTRRLGTTEVCWHPPGEAPPPPSAPEPRSGAYADRVRAARLAAGLSQRQLAERSGLTQSDISKVERGVHVPGPERVAAIEAVLGIAQPDAPAPGLPPGSPTGRAHDGAPHCPPPPVERATAQPSGEAAAEDAAHTHREASGSVEDTAPTSPGRERAAPEPASVGVLTGERGRDDNSHSLWLLRSLLEAEREVAARLRARVSELAEEHALVDQARRAAEEDVADFRESLAVAEEQLRDVSRVLDLVDEDGSGLNLPARVALLVGELRALRGGR